jgi:hypothetical protein
LAIEKKLLPVLVLCALVAPGAASKVLVRWTQKTMPPAKSLGVSDLALSWNADTKVQMDVARDRGYRVYLEVTAQQIEAAAELGMKEGFAGIILEPAPGEQHDAEQLLRKLRTTYPKVEFRLLLQGKQPQMRGTLVYERDGILQASSPTAQPWVDSNLATVRFAQAFHPESAPLYAFSWGSSDPLQKQLGPSAAEYALAVAEAGAFHADLILELPENLQKSLAHDDAEARTTWKQVQHFMEFYDRGNRDALRPVTNVCVWTDNEDSSYEAVNLMARHNIQVRVLRKTDLNSESLRAVDILIAFTTPEEAQIRLISDFVTDGGTAVLVNVHGSYPWQSTNSVRRSAQAVEYEIGKGRIIEFSGAITDPETFSQDIRRLMAKERVSISLWNTLTTIVVSYRDFRTDHMMLELINYEGEPLQVQVQVKGSFASIRYETPERGCCEALIPRQANGFTEFLVPNLVIGGRVHLAPAAGNKDGHYAHDHKKTGKDSEKRPDR